MWHAIELRELRAYLVLCEELHFARSAERLGLTQSRISQIIQGLERKLGVELVYRTSRRVELTPAGERFRKEIGAAVSALENVLRKTGDAHSWRTEPVRLGIMAAAQIVPALRAAIDAYERAHPDSSVELVGLPFTDRFGPLRRGEIELMLTGLPLHQADLVTGPVLARIPRLLAVGRGHPLADRDAVSIEELADHRVGELDVALPPELHEELVPRRTPAGRPIPRMRQRIREASELIVAVSSGRIVQPVTAAFAATYRHPDVLFLPISDLPLDRVVLAWRRRNRHPGLREFLRVLHELPRHDKPTSTAPAKGARGRR
jgi:DNA-binding transcriptional LysR family regulator